MRIACLQFAPHVGDVNNNLNRADAVLNKASPEDIDLLVLPELAFTGYNFKSLQHIAPYLEPSGSGITALWARTTALKYDCVVAVGYPEKVDVAEKWPTSPEYYNSAIVVNGDGETILNYRKSFLYYTDETWALEGDGFFEGHIPGLGHTAMGICMDINPYRFEAPWHAFEFAFHILEYQTNLVIISMSWLTREDQRTFSRMPKEPDMETLTYWITRLEPVIRAENDDEIIVVFANRTGTEDDAVYAGTSAVIGIHHGEVNVYGILGRGDKELLVVDTNNEPYAHLVYRPGNEYAEDTADLRPTRPKSENGSIPEADDRPSMFAPEPTPAREPTPNPGRSTDRSYEHVAIKQNGTRSRNRSSSPSGRSARSFSSTKSEVSVKSKASSKSSASRTREHKKGSSTMRTGGHSSSTSKLSSHTHPKPQAQPMPQHVPKLNTRAEGIKSPKKERPSPKITIPVFDPNPSGTIPTPTAPSPTPIDLRPNLGVPTSSRRGRRGNHDDTPHPATGPVRDPWQLYSSRASAKHDPFTPVTAFPDVDSPTSPRYFWVPSDNLLKTPALPKHSTDSSQSQSQSRQQRRAEAETPLTAIQVHSGSNYDMSRRTGVPKRPTPHPHEVRKANPSRSTSQKPREVNRSKGSFSDESLLDGPNPHVSDKPIPPRPSSPKSRHTSRQRGQERPGSAMDQPAIQRPGSSMANQRSGSAMAVRRPGSSMADKRPGSSMATHRPGSAMASRRKGSSEGATPARPSSPKSRNASRSRGNIDPPVDQRLTSLSRASILIAASPSIYDTSIGRPRSASFQQEAIDAMRARVEGRHGSVTNRPASAMGRNEKYSPPARETSETPLMPVNFVDFDDRTISRGRQREPRYVPAERSHSANSTWPEVPRSRFPSPERNFIAADEIIAVEGTVSPNCPVHGAHHPPGEHTLDEIVAIEGTVSESCPVHGSHSRPPHERRRTNSAARGINPSLPRNESSPRSDGARRGSARRQSHDRRESAQRHGPARRESNHRMDSSRRRESAQRRSNMNSNQRNSPPQQYLINKDKESPKYSASVETLATPGDSPATPQPEPSTPKAMILLSEKELLTIPPQLQAIAKPVQSMPQPPVQLVCRDRDELENGIHRPKSAVW